MGAAFAYDISFLRYYQYEKEQNDDFPLYFAHRSLPAVHVCLSDRSDSYYELFKVDSLTAPTSAWSFYGLQNYFKIMRNAGFISSMKTC